MKKLTTEQFIDKAKLVHGNKYNYLKTDYKSSTVKVTIICPTHGEFTKRPNDHLSGQGCKKCSMKISTLEGFIKKCKEVHKDKYTYDKVSFTKVSDIIVVTCQIHGDFTIRASAHLRGDNCGKCKGSYYDRESFIKAAQFKFGDKFDYSKVFYKNSKTNVTIICSEHGKFVQTPSTHLNSHGCPECGKKQSIISNTKSLEVFVEQANSIFNNAYNYTDTVYTKGSNYITVNCPIENHGNFNVIAKNHLQGQGCPCCNPGGFKMDKPAILYYLSINNGEAYKIGITNRLIKERFCREDLAKIRVIHQIKYPLGKLAYDEEQRILKEYNMYKYIGPNLLKSGNTELFSKDIFCK